MHVLQFQKFRAHQRKVSYLPHSTYDSFKSEIHFVILLSHTSSQKSLLSKEMFASSVNSRSCNLSCPIHIILPKDQSLENSASTERSRRKRKVCDTGLPSCISQLLTIHKSIEQTSEVSCASSLSSRIRLPTMASMQQLSTLQRMIYTEDIDRLKSNDYKALKDVDPSFHKQAWRERVALWFYDVLDYLEESRDVAAVAMDIIDRYLAVLSKESDSTLVIGEFDYEVISFTALFLAIRISGSSKDIEISQLLHLRSGSEAPQARHIVAAGNSMLKKLSWNHQILTPNLFLRELVSILMTLHNEQEHSSTHEATCESLSNLVDFASYLLEISVCDFYFSTTMRSKIAFGALALAMMCDADFFSSSGHCDGFLFRFFEIIRDQTSMDIECPEMNSIISRLLHVYNQSQEATIQNIGQEPIQQEGQDTNVTLDHSMPHVIEDEDEEPNTRDAKVLPNSRLERLVEDENNSIRPVTPLQHGFG